MRPFRTLVQEAGESSEYRQASIVKVGSTVSLQAVDLPLSQALRQVHLESGASFVIAAESGKVPVNCAVFNEPVDRVVASLARAAGVAAVWQSPRLCYVGEMLPEDAAVMFRRVRRGAAAEIQQLVGVLVSNSGRVHVAEDGLLVVADKFDSIQRIAEMLEQLDEVRVPVWAVEIYGVQSRESFERRMSLEIAPTASLGLAIADGHTPRAVGQAAFTAYLQAVSTSRDSRLQLRPLMLIPDGKSSRIGVSSERYVQRNTVTPEGVTISNGFDRIEAGTICEVSVRESNAENAAINLRLDVTTFVIADGEALPGVEGLKLDMPLVVRSGVPYMVGAFDDVDQSRTHDTWLSWGRGLFGRKNKLSVWLRATRVDLAADGSAATLERAPAAEPVQEVQEPAKEEKPQDLLGAAKDIFSF